MPRRSQRDSAKAAAKQKPNRACTAPRDIVCTSGDEQSRRKQNKKKRNRAIKKRGCHRRVGVFPQACYLPSRPDRWDTEARTKTTALRQQRNRKEEAISSGSRIIERSLPTKRPCASYRARNNGPVGDERRIPRKVFNERIAQLVTRTETPKSTNVKGK